MAGLDDYYCVHVKRYGALGIPEIEHKLHAVTQSEAEDAIKLIFLTLCPGDKTEITLTRGVQHAGE